MTQQSPVSSSRQSCVHQPACPGCPRFGQDGIALAAERSLRAFCESAGIALSQRFAAGFGYRGRARLAIRGSSDAPKIGVFELGSHKIVNIPNCAVHHPLINQVAQVCADAIRATRASIYSDDGHVGALRYLQVVRERETGLAQVTVVANATAASLRGFLKTFQNGLDGRLHSLFFSESRQRTNTILTQPCDRIWGAEAVRERIGGADVFFPPDAFGQANLGLFDSIVEQIHSWALAAPEAGKICELYAGVGAIGLGLAQLGAAVTFNEISPGSLRGLRMGLASLPTAARLRCRVLEGDAAAATPALADSKVVVVDPPRKGLAPAVIEELVRLSRDGNAPELIYLSCGLPSFLEDARALIDGGFRLSECYAYALFPFTEHVETLARFASAHPEKALRVLGGFG